MINHKSTDGLTHTERVLADAYTKSPHAKPVNPCSSDYRNTKTDWLNGDAAKLELARVILTAAQSAIEGLAAGGAPWERDTEDALQNAADSISDLIADHISPTLDAISEELSRRDA